MKGDAERRKKQLTAKKKSSKLDWSMGLSSGSTLLNLACTGRPSAAALPGDFVWAIGDSHSGKTWLALSFLAEAANNPKYKDYALIYDSVENGAKMDKEKFFGKSLVERLLPPAYDENDESLPAYSTTVEEFYFNLSNCFDSGTPVIYVLDSMDALDSEADEEKFDEQLSNYNKGKQTETGSYGTSKAKINSSGLRRAALRLTKTNSILIVISQTRDAIGFGAQFNPKTVSGGKALKFYTGIQLWMAAAGDVTSTRKGKTRKLGIKSQVKVEKNRYTGQKHVVKFPIKWNYGLDDLTSMIEWMVEEGVWKKEKEGVNAKELGLKGTVDGLVVQVEERGLERELKLAVTEAWEDIVESCNTGRKPRYQ